MASDLNDEAEEELLALKSIYEDKLNFEETEMERKIRIPIHPATGEDVASQYVCLEIVFTLLTDYPKTPPVITFAMSRGLSDGHLDKLLKRMRDFALERSGECILFDLMEMAKDILTSNNIPSCPCSICLMSFHECDDFLKTECYHYFHSFCLNQYVEYLIKQDSYEGQKKETHSENEYDAPCPVCRLVVILRLAALKDAQPPINDKPVQLDAEAMGRQRQLHGDRYKRQLEKGGLIDLEHEKNKYLLSNIEQNYQVQMTLASESNQKNDQGNSIEPNNKEEHLDGGPSKPAGNTKAECEKNQKGSQRHTKPSKNRGYFNKARKATSDLSQQNYYDKTKHPPSKYYRGKNDDYKRSNERQKMVQLEVSERREENRPSSSHSDTKQQPRKKSQHRDSKNDSRNFQHQVQSNGNGQATAPVGKDAQTMSGRHRPKPKDFQHEGSRALRLTSTTFKRVERPPGFPMKPPPGFENVKPIKRISP